MDKYSFPAKTDELNKIVQITWLRNKVRRVKGKRKKTTSLKETFSLPCVLLEHRADVPCRAESTQASAEALVVNGPRVNREQSHQQNQIPSSKHHPPDLRHTVGRFSSLVLRWFLNLFFFKRLEKKKKKKV